MSGKQTEVKLEPEKDRFLSFIIGASIGAALLFLEWLLQLF